MLFFQGDVPHQAAIPDELLHEGGNGLDGKRLSFGAHNGDPSRIAIHFDMLTPGHAVPQFSRFEDRKAHVEGVAVKDPREAPGDDTGNPGCLDRDGGMFPGGTATEVLTGYDDIARANVPGELCIEILHAVTRQLCGIGRCQMTGRDDGIRVDIVSELPDLSSESHDCPPENVHDQSASGPAIRPRTAEAAATAGLAR